MPPSLAERAWTLLLILLLAALCLALAPRSARSQPACTHYASATGTGTACSQAQPCALATWLGAAAPGQTLCLLDGVYARTQAGTIMPPAGRAGTASARITVRALHEGQVTLDGENGFAVLLGVGNDYWDIWGVNGRNAGESLYRVKGSHNRFMRVIGYTGTSGQDNANIFSFDGVDNLAEDVAAWGMNVRKVFNASQSTAAEQQQYNTFRRAWGEWNDHPQGSSCPNNTFQLGYRSREQRFENVLGTARFGEGQICGFEGALSAFYDCPTASMVTHSEVLGSVFYALDGQGYPAGRAGVYSFCTSNLTFRDVASVFQSTYTTSKPFDIRNFSETTAEADNLCDNCLAVHAGTPSVVQAGAGWTMRNFHEGKGLTEATGGTSAFVLLPGLCTRYEAGTLTRAPLWPWPMQQRIHEARIASGFPPVDVTADIEALLGPIPPQCQGDGGQAPVDTTPPVVTVVAPTDGAMVSGTAVSVLADASDNVGIRGLQWLVNGIPHGAEETSLPWGHEIDTTLLANGVYTLAARARDASGNVTTSLPVEVRVVNGPIGPARPLPPTPSPLTCTGDLLAGGKLAMRCVPQAQEGR